MNAAELKLPQATVQKLLCAGSSDAALLFLYIESGNSQDTASRDLNISDARVHQAAAVLRQLGLYSREATPMRMVGERPQYSEPDVVRAMDRDTDFRNVYEDVQKILGRPLNTEELKILLGFIRYLGMEPEVVSFLVNHCREDALQKGRRAPTLRSIEKTAYAWAEKDIVTLEDAVAYVKGWQARSSRIGQLKQQLQIRDRSLSPSEEKYANQWLDWGFDMEALAIAYDRTCLNTGGLSWHYMNKILSRWQAAGLLTGEQIRTGDVKPGSIRATSQPGDAERAAILKTMQEV